MAGDSALTTAEGLPDEEGKIDAELVSALYQEHGEQLRRFLRGVLGDDQLAGDAMQSAFAIMLEEGHASREETRKAWLFRVAYNEALEFRRRQAVGKKAMQGLAWIQKVVEETSDQGVMRAERVDWVRQAIDELVAEQQQVVRMRIYEEKTFATISQELDIPLGTALGRMRSALARLREILVQKKDKP